MVPASEWAAVIAPFRSGSTGKGGAGLGLAIASDAIRSHGGSICFAMRADGFAAVLMLPLSSREMPAVATSAKPSGLGPRVSFWSRGGGPIGLFEKKSRRFRRTKRPSR